MPAAQPSSADVDALLKSFADLPKEERSPVHSRRDPELDVQGTVVLGIPVERLAPDWRFARLLQREDFLNEQTAGSLHAMDAYGWSFELLADVDEDGFEEKAGVGVFETYAGHRGTFFLVAGSEGVERLEITSEKAGFGAIRFNEKGLNYGGCMECDDLRYFPMTGSQEEAACVVPQEKLGKLVDAHRMFRSDPSSRTAQAFIDNLPPDFCRFNAVYGYDEMEGAAVLYNEPLHELIPEIAKHIPETQLLEKFVHYATAAYWRADNISALQQAYRSIADRHVQFFVGTLASYPEGQRINAYKFLFDGPHPESSSGFAESLRTRVCVIDARSCAELQIGWASALKHPHHWSE